MTHRITSMPCFIREMWLFTHNNLYTLLSHTGPFSPLVDIMEALSIRRHRFMRAFLDVRVFNPCAWLIKSTGHLYSGEGKHQRMQTCEEQTHGCQLCNAVSQVKAPFSCKCCWSWRHSKRMSGQLNKLFADLWWSYTAFALSIAYIDPFTIEVWWNFANCIQSDNRKFRSHPR